jgi:hypothetical protein
MTSKRNLLGILAAVLGLLAASATPLHAVQVRLLGWSAADGDLQFDADRKPGRLKVFPDSFSPVIEFEGTGPIVLYKMVEHEGKPRKQIACTITVPAGMEQGLLILVPGDQSKAAFKKVIPDESGFVSAGAPLIYDYLWFDDSPKARPPGTLEFRNLSRLPIALQIDQNQLMLVPQSKAQVPLVQGAKRMPLRAAAQIGGQWKLFRSNPLSTRSPDRMLVILRDAGPQNADAGEPNIMMISLYDWPRSPAAPDSKASTAALAASGRRDG